MGSGISGNYNGTLEKSQPYASTYGVTKDLLELDKKNPDIYDLISGYFKNPTAINLRDAIVNNHIFIDNKLANGTMTYVMDKDGNIIFGIRRNPNNPHSRTPHPTLIGGISPRVKCAGMITFSKGRIVSIDNSSGHFKPNIRSMKEVNEYMDKLYKENPEVFNRNSKWRNKK